MRHPIGRNAVALYWVQGATFVLPFLTLPYLSRVLGSSGFGLVVFSLGFASLIGMFVDYGFDASVPREISAARHDRHRLARIVSDVLGARLMLLSASLLTSLIALAAVPKLREHPIYLVCAFVGGVATGFSPIFFFMGIERLPRAAYVQLATRVFAAAMTFVIVRGRDDGWRVLLLFAMGSAGGCFATNWMMYRTVPPVRLRFRSSWDVLRGAGTLFVGFTAGAMYTSANVVVLGLFVSSAEVAYFGAAEKIVRAVIQVLTPISYVIYPRVSLLLAKGEAARARRLVHIAMAVLGGVALLMAGGLILLAPLLIRVVYGHAFHPAVMLLRVLALILIPLATSLILYGCWMLALKLDRKVLRVAASGAAVNLLLAVVLVPLLGPLGMAIAVLTAETSVLLSCLRFIRRNERNKGVPALLGAPGGSLWGELRALLVLAGARARGGPSA